MFEYLASEFMARLTDRFPPTPMMDSRLPYSEETEINEALSSIIDMIEANSRFITKDNVENLKILEVDKENDWALIEIKPKK
ncbi:hypothetical protein D3C85_14240 [compost metagenome]